MVALSWDNVGERFYEAGVDRGVLYLRNPQGGYGVAWNGLVSVNETPDGGVSTPYYFDGIKYHQEMEVEDFRATIEAFTYPDEFSLCDGTAYEGNGLSFGLQSRREFDFTYRTRVGSDLDGDLGYKIHLIYNAKADPTQRSNGTLKDVSTPLTFSWNIAARPRYVSNVRPTAHVMIDSRTTPKATLDILESYLYGAEGITPKMPSPDQLRELMDWSIPIDINFKGVGNYNTSYIYNRFYNPSFEKVSSSAVEIWRNIFPNPEFTATSGTVEVRRNYLWDPDFRSLPTDPRWVGDVANATRVSTGYQFDYPSGQASATNIIYTNDRPATSEGDTWASSVEVSVPSGYPAVQLRLTQRIYGSPNVDGAGGAVTIGPGETKIITTPATTAIASSTDTRFILISAATIPAGSRFIVRRALTEKGGRVGGSIFSGAGMSVADVDLTASWTGAVNASESVLTGVGVAGVTGLWCAVIQSTKWRASGTYSIRLIPNSDKSNNSYAYTSPDILTLGTEYTAVGVVRTEAPLTGSLLSTAMRLQLASPTVQSEQKPNTAGEAEVRVTGTTTATGRVILRHGGYVDSGDVWWDLLTVVEGDYRGGAFSGARTPDSDLIASWTGSQNASPSILSGLVPDYVTTGWADRPVVQAGFSVSRPKSIKIIPRKATSDYGAIIDTSMLTPGASYVAIAKLRLSAPITGTIRPGGLRIYYGTISSRAYESPQAPNVAGTHTLRMVFTADASTNQLRLAHGGDNGSGSVWFDDLIIVSGSTYNGAWFSGDSPDFVYNNQIVNPSWIGGQPNDAQSQIAVLTSFPPNPVHGDAYLIGTRLWAYDNGKWHDFGTPPLIYAPGMGG